MTIDETMLQLQRQQQLQENSRLQQGTAGTAAETPEEQERLREACREFEAIFLNIMLKQMRSGVEESGLVEKSHARGIFEEMHDEELAKSMAQGRGVGLAQQLYQQLTAVTVAPVKKDS
ncbi:rod-binding protein [Anoxynatronum buryatiense]|uniref:Rod binding protein n=1 Tax=Anoxynatronum buryatiense TaxID=489973 RepID=A0AA46AIP5_9CLOT|nr:rod-binding protein [Anoxynatronum buryatiense]SMP52434.1 Rod binding protein [Anoxynatronum buryatiense]